MSTKSNKFGFGPVEETPQRTRPERSPGPMGVAVRDAADTLSETTEAKVAQRRQNAEEAREFRRARDSGLLLVELPLAQIKTDDLPRDRMELEEVAGADEMEELKASIKQRGQKEPIEVFRDGQGGYQLKKGWRRLTALSQLHAETGDASFATVVARIETGEPDRVLRYIDMVEENVVREDLTFAEMAQVAIAAAQDPDIDETDPAELVTRLYGALHKTKRSYIRSFVFLLVALGESLKFPKAVARNLGVEVSRSIHSEEQIVPLRDALFACETAEAQSRILSEFVKEGKRAPAQAKAATSPRQKLEFFVGKTKVTARHGEMRIVCDRDFASTPRHVLEAAIAAFEEALTARPRIR